MTLDSEFRRVVQENIQTFIAVLGESSKDQSYLKKVWKFEHERDYRYGYVVGFLTGSSIMLFKMIYNRPANSDENAEIKEIIETHAQQIRQMLDEG